MLIDNTSNQPLVQGSGNIIDIECQLEIALMAKDLTEVCKCKYV